MKIIQENKWLTWVHQLINFRLVAQSVLLISTFVLLKRIVTRGTLDMPQRLRKALPDSPADSLIPYEEWTMFGSALLDPRYFIVFAVFTSASFMFCRSISWSAYGRMTRVFVCFAVAIMTWINFSYGYNLYVDQAHILDRVLILSLCIATFLYPAFIAPFICVALLSVSQFAYPLGGHSLTGAQMPLDVMFLFSAFHLNMIGKQVLSRLTIFVRTWRRRSGRIGARCFSYALSRPRWLLVGLNGRLFFFVLLCMVGSAYLIPALHKIEISPSGTEWLLQNSLDRHVAGSVLRDNHFFFSEGGGETALILAQKFGRFLVIVTMIIEISALLIVVNRRLSFLILMLLAFLHIGICTLSGIFFWKWALLDLLLAGLILTREARPVFTRQAFALSIVLMLSATLHFSPIALGWFDTSLIKTYRLIVTTDEGDEFVISGSSMKPYESYFSSERFGFLNPQGKLAGMDTTTDFEVADEINRMETADIASRLQEAAVSDAPEIDQDESERFDRFIKRYFGNWNRKLDRDLMPFDFVRSSPHILSGNSEGAFQWDRRVARVDVYYETAHYDGETVIPLGVHLIRRIDIPPQQ